METFWRYVRIQAMMFVFGCVGPIFLVLFFSTRLDTGPDPSMKWAYWFGLFITAADVLIALALTDAGRRDDDDDRTPLDMRLAVAFAKRRDRGD
ncbi:hypothetical protein ACN27E_13800 [Mycobacterium sp. WMMD1722]|uniref:hypothetical protein n=1 Tax=Mycobacterium sp. WMMD1722 TaxID=3404117 RepID=UPI003BF5614C